ncbi:MAG: hypothetical protein ChlgKO_07230 [Chlamydiales bacterium]
MTLPVGSPSGSPTIERKKETPETAARADAIAQRAVGSRRDPQRNLMKDFNLASMELPRFPMDLQNAMPFACSTPDRENCDPDKELREAIDVGNRGVVLSEIVKVDHRIYDPNSCFGKVVTQKWETEALLLAAKTEELSDSSVVTRCIQEGWHPVITVLFIRNPHLYAQLDKFLEQLDEVENQPIATFFKKAKELKLDKRAQFEQYIKNGDWNSLKIYLDDPNNPVFDPDDHCAYAIRSYQPEVAAKLAKHTSNFRDIDAIEIAKRGGLDEVLGILFEKNPELENSASGLHSSTFECYDNTIDFEGNYGLNPDLKRARQLFQSDNDGDAATQVLLNGNIQNLQELIEAADAINWEQTLNALRIGIE